MITKNLVNATVSVEDLLIKYGYSFKETSIRIDKKFLMKSYNRVWIKNISDDQKYICEISHGIGYKVRSRSVGVSIINSKTQGLFSVNEYIFKKHVGRMRAPRSAKNYSDRLKVVTHNTNVLAEVIEKDLEDLFLGKVWLGSNIHTQD